MSDSKIDTSNYVVLAYTANYWVKGSAATPYDTIVRRLRGYTGTKHLKKHGCVLYHIHPDFEVCAVTGDIRTPIGHPAIKIEDRRPVKWSRDGDQWVGTLPGGKECRITEWFGGPLGRMLSITANGQRVGSVGGGENRTMLKRAKAEAEKALKLDRKPAPATDEKPGAIPACA